MTTDPITYDAEVDQYMVTVVAASGTRYRIGVRPRELTRLWLALSNPATEPLRPQPAPVQGADPTGPQTDADGDDSTRCGEVIRVGDEVVDCSYDEGHSGDHLDATGKVAWSELGLRVPDPWADGEREKPQLRPDIAEALAAEMAFDHYRAGRRREGKALDAYRARLAELRASAEEAQS